jgi:hypothetical protein
MYVDEDWYVPEELQFGADNGLGVAAQAESKDYASCN